MKNFKNFINGVNVIDYLKPKSEEEIEKVISKITKPYDKIRYIYKYDLPKKHLREYTQEYIKETVKYKIKRHLLKNFSNSIFIFGGYLTFDYLELDENKMKKDKIIGFDTKGIILEKQSLFNIFFEKLYVLPYDYLSIGVLLKISEFIGVDSYDINNHPRT